MRGAFLDNLPIIAFYTLPQKLYSEVTSNRQRCRRIFLFNISVKMSGKKQVWVQKPASMMALMASEGRESSLKAAQGVSGEWVWFYQTSYVNLLLLHWFSKSTFKLSTIVLQTSRDPFLRNDGLSWGIAKLCLARILALSSFWFLC